MSQPDWSDAYVLHRRPYRETSYIVDFFSLQTGKVSAVAKGVRSSKNERKSLLQPFRKVRIQLSGKTDLKNLRQIESGGPVPMLAGNDLFCAMYLNEILNRVMPAGLASDTVYAQYEHALNSLIVQPDIEKTLREFEFSLLEEMGMLADWFTDGLSGEAIEPDGWYLYSPEQGFVACHQPGHKHRLPGTALIELGNGEWTALSRRAAKLINRHALHQLLGGKPLKSRELFRA